MKVDLLLLEHLGFNLPGTAPVKADGEGAVSFAALLGENLAGLSEDGDAAGGEPPHEEALFQEGAPAGSIPPAEGSEQGNQSEGDGAVSGLQLFLALKGLSDAGLPANAVGDAEASNSRPTGPADPEGAGLSRQAAAKGFGPGQLSAEGDFVTREGLAEGLKEGLKEDLKEQGRPGAESSRAAAALSPEKTANTGREQVVQASNTAAFSRLDARPGTPGEGSAAAQKYPAGIPGSGKDTAGPAGEAGKAGSARAELYGTGKTLVEAETTGGMTKAASSGTSEAAKEPARTVFPSEAETLPGREAAESAARSAANSSGGSRNANPVPEQAPVFQQPSVQGDDSLQAGKVLQQAAGTEHKASVMQQIEGRLVYLRETAANPAEMRMTLHPPELGEVTIRVFSKAGKLSATIIAETQLVKEILESSIGEMRQRFNFVSIDFEQLDLSTADKQPGGFGRPGAGRETAGFFNGPDPGNRGTAESETAPPPEPAGPVGSGIDFWA